MKKNIIVVVVLFTMSSLFAQTFYSRYDFAMAPSSTFQQGLIGFINPANSALLRAPEARFYWNDGLNKTHWGLFAAFPGVGFGAYKHHVGSFSVTDYRVSTALGNRKFAFGTGYNWSRGDINALKRESEWSMGTVWRPVRFISLGAAGIYGSETHEKQGIFELGVRPLGDSFVTLFADMFLNDDMRVQDAPWSAGAALQVAPGVNLVGRYFNTEQFTLGLSLDFGFSSYAHQQYFDAEQNNSHNSHHIRIGGMRDNVIMPLLGRNRSYVPIELHGPVKYQTYFLSMDGSVSFLNLLQNIKACGSDPRVKILALNISNVTVQAEKAWEIHCAIRDIKKEGKTVIAFIQDCGSNQYMIASAADRIFMDPEGMLMMPGYLFNRTYYKGTLEKLGLQFDEWRFMKYKSAAESFSRKSMSEADREQLDALVEDFYSTLRKKITESRSLSANEFDDLVNQKVILLADEAIKHNLVDTLARWID